MSFCMYFLWFGLSVCVPCLTSWILLIVLRLMQSCVSVFCLLIWFWTFVCIPCPPPWYVLISALPLQSCLSVLLSWELCALERPSFDSTHKSRAQISWPWSLPLVFCVLMCWFIRFNLCYNYFLPIACCLSSQVDSSVPLVCISGFVSFFGPFGIRFCCFCQAVSFDGCRCNFPPWFPVRILNFIRHLNRVLWEESSVAIAGLEKRFAVTIAFLEAAWLNVTVIVISSKWSICCVCCPFLRRRWCASPVCVLLHFWFCRTLLIPSWLCCALTSWWLCCAFSSRWVCVPS